MSTLNINKFQIEDFKLKEMKCEFNILSKSDGSAILSQGETVVLVSVNGPLETKMQSQTIEKGLLEVLFCGKSGKSNVPDRYKENIIRQTSEAAVLSILFPRTAITITVQELEDYGGLLACTLNCTCLALINSGIAMRCLFAAVTCAVNEKGDIVLEPDKNQLKTARAVMNFVFDSRDKNLITVFTEGNFSEDTYKEAMERCRATSDVIFKFYRDIVKQYSNVIG